MIGGGHLLHYEAFISLEELSIAHPPKNGLEKNEKSHALVLVGLSMRKNSVKNNDTMVGEFFS